MKVKINIQRNQFVLKTENKSQTFKASQNFSYPRLLVGDFEAAQACLIQGAKAMGLIGLFKGKHDVRVEVKDYFGDGITPLERKVYRELVHCMKVASFELELVKG
ncbi:MAG: hypothetical protein ACSHWU_10330 [Marinicella sp.]